MTVCSIDTGFLGQAGTQKWMDIFSDDEPDLMDKELVQEFDNLTRKFG